MSHRTNSRLLLVAFNFLLLLALSAPLRAQTGLTISPTTCTAAGTVGTTFTPYQFTASGGGISATYNWYISGGETNQILTGQGLASGLTLGASSGQITGVPNSNAVGTLSFTVLVVSSIQGFQATRACSITISQAQTLSITCPAPTGTAPYSSQAIASGGFSSSYVWSLVSGTLAPLTLNTSTGLISGSSTITGTFNFTLGLNRGPEGGGITKACSITIAAPVNPVKVSCTNKAANVAGGGFYTTTCTGSGGTQPYFWSISTATPLPSWLPQTASTATTITYAGTVPDPPPLSYSLNVIATDSANSSNSGSDTLTINVSPSLSAICQQGPNAAKAGAVYSMTCSASGGTTSYSWTFPTALPSWLTPTSTAGSPITLSGTVPAQPLSSYTVNASVTDSTTPAITKAAPAFTINVATALTLNCPAPSSAKVGVSLSVNCTVSGGSAPYAWVYTNLPSWLPAGSATTTTPSVTLTGTPTNPPSAVNFSVTVSDNSSPKLTSAPFQVTFTPLPATLSITNCSSTTATGGVFFTTTCNASGGVAPYTWAYTNLPSWLSASGTTGTSVTLSGTPPVTAISYSPTVTLTDSTSPTKQSAQPLTLTISVSIAPVSGASITQNSAGLLTNQSSLQVKLTQSAVTAYSGTLTLSFKPDSAVANVPSTYVDPAGGFPAASNTTQFTKPFSISQGQTQSDTAPFGLGTVAGTWTGSITALSPGGVPSGITPFSIAVAPATPVITPGTVKIVFNSGNTGISVTLSGYATTREVTSATFVFSAAGGAQISGGTVTVPFSGQDQVQWFNTDLGRSNGGNFSLVQPFAYSGDASALNSVSVTLTNSRGASVAVVGTR